jgi:hypothetical protein
VSGKIVANMLDTICESWGWTGLEPAAVVADNAFGNVIVRAADGVFWRICPEELSCAVVAPDAVAFERMWADADFQLDWQMAPLVEIARTLLGPVDGDRCYCLKFPAVLGGAYEPPNFGTITRRELIAFAGDAARQIRDVPDGGQVSIEWKK